jgi:hypothetical protein
MLINSSLGFMEVSGWQNLDMSMAYFVRYRAAWSRRWHGASSSAAKNKAEIDPDQIDEIDIIGDSDKVRYLNIRITCTPDDYKVGLGWDKK